MSKHYLIARRRDNSYTTIDVNGGNKLEEIDIYTSSFFNKNDLLQELEKKGLEVGDGIDLFIATYSSKLKKVRTRRVLYKTIYNDELRSNAKRSLKGQSIDTERLYKQAASLDGNYRSLVHIGYFDMYKAFERILANRGKKLEYHHENKWLEDDYKTYRDVLASILVYHNLNIKDLNDHDRALQNKSELKAQRQMIVDSLTKTLTSPYPGQEALEVGKNRGSKTLSLSQNNNNFIHIDNIELDNVKENTTVVKEKRKGLIKETEGQINIDDMISSQKTVSLNRLLGDAVNYDENNRKEAESSIYRFLTSGAYIKTGTISEKGKEVSLNYKNLPFDLDPEEKAYLEKLKSSKVLFRRVNEYHRYQDTSFIAQVDKFTCADEIRARLKKLSLRSINNLAKFCVLYKDCYDKAISKEEVKDGYRR
ncbi:MAG: hypothetical protein IJH13_00170 [Bacilli bacterium]|nr:hypothetical protein [Bacilli bacterium]